MVKKRETQAEVTTECDEIVPNVDDIKPKKKKKAAQTQMDLGTMQTLNESIITNEEPLVKKKKKKEKLIPESAEEAQLNGDQFGNPPHEEEEPCEPLVKKKKKAKLVPESSDDAQFNVDQFRNPHEEEEHCEPLVKKKKKKAKLVAESAEEAQLNVDQFGNPPHEEVEPCEPLVKKTKKKKAKLVAESAEEAQLNGDQFGNLPHEEEEPCEPLVKKTKKKKAKLVPESAEEAQLNGDQFGNPYEEEEHCEPLVKKKKKKAKLVAESADDGQFNVDQFRNPLEEEEHWELRRAFFEKNQHVLPLDELVCFAQVYMNVELLQCRYPPETMQQVAKLSEGLAKDYHRSRAYMLKRTFVSASDAAASKVRREDVLTTANNDNSNTDNGTEGPSGMIPRNVMDCIRKDVVIIDNNVSNTMVAFNKLSNGMQMKIFNQCLQDGVHEASVEIAGFTIGKARGDTSKVAQSTVSGIVLSFLSQHCYALKRKMHVSQIEGIEVLSKAETSYGSAENNTTDSTKLSSDNLGFQLMTKLGWTGGSLGARGDGILDPVDMEQKFDRTGLGKDALDGKMNAATIKQKLYELRNSTEQDRIVFSSEYTKQERKLIHSLAQALNLRSLSYGKDYNKTRRLVVSRRLLGSREILRKILTEKDPLYCKMYEVVPPAAQE